MLAVQQRLMPIGSPPLRLFTPGTAQPTAPHFIFLPGMDGTGQLIRHQLPNLQRYFDVRSLAISPDSELSWAALTETLAQLIQQHCRASTASPAVERPVYLCGESFGGCLALQLAAYYPHLVDRLILVNPASSFRQRFWLGWGVGVVRSLPVSLFHLSAHGLLPFLANVDRVDGPNRQDLLMAMQSVPPTSASWRIRLLMAFNTDPFPLEQMQIPTLLVASRRDRLLPSWAEAHHLQQRISPAEILGLPASGHACLLEATLNLSELLRQKQFLPKKVVNYHLTTR